MTYATLPKTPPADSDHPPALATLPMVMPEEAIYKSYDGLEIAGILYKPKHPNGAALVSSWAQFADDATHRTQVHSQQAHKIFLRQPRSLFDRFQRHAE